MRLQEIELLRSLSFDANIVQYYGACLQEENTMMVLEYMAVSTSIACFYMYFLHATCAFVMLCLHLHLLLRTAGFHVLLVTASALLAPDGIL